MCTTTTRIHFLVPIKDGYNWGGGCPPPPVVTRRHDSRHKKTRSQIEPRRVQGGRQHTPSTEASNANHCIVQETVYFVFCWCTRVLIHCHSAPGFLFTVTVTVSTTFLVTDSDGA